MLAEYFSEDPETFRRQVAILAATGLVLLVVIAITIKAQAWILQKASRAARINVSDGLAVQTATAVFFVNTIIMVPIGYLLRASEAPVHIQGAVQVFLLPMSYLIQAWIISEFLEIKFGQAAKITLFMLIVTFMIIGFFVGMGFLIAGAAEQAANGY